jgi:phytoene synthase
MESISFGKLGDLNLESSYRYCENIAKQKNPFLYFVSQFFRDKNKFKAFCSTYSSMRILDDFIDGIDNRKSLSNRDKNSYHSAVDRWETLITNCYHGKEFENPILLALSDTFRKFNLHLTPWTKLAKAMRWDIENLRFKNFEDFLEYTEGAAIAPASVCINILTAKHNSSIYEGPVMGFDSYYYAKDLAIYCYLVHILRDISIDLESEKNGLVYIPVDDLNRFKVSEDDLWKFKQKRVVNTHFQKLMLYQIERAKKYVEKGEILLEELYHELDVDCKFILNLLVSLYKKTMDKIERVRYNVFIGKHGVDDLEIFKTAYHHAKKHSFGKLKTIRFGLSLLRKKVLTRHKE